MHQMVHCSYGKFSFVNGMSWVDSKHLVNASITLWQPSINPLPVAEARLPAPEDLALIIYTEQFSFPASCYMPHFPGNLAPCSTSVYWAFKYIIQAVHAIYIVIASINLWETAINCHPWSWTWLLALEDVVIWVDAPNVAISWGRDMLQSSRDGPPAATSINWAFWR